MEDDFKATEDGSISYRVVDEQTVFDPTVYEVSGTEFVQHITYEVKGLDLNLFEIWNLEMMLETAIKNENYLSAAEIKKVINHKKMINVVRNWRKWNKFVIPKVTF